MAGQVSDFALGRIREWGVHREGLAAHGFRQKLAEYYERLPHRSKLR